MATEKPITEMTNGELDALTKSIKVEEVIRKLPDDFQKVMRLFLERYPKTELEYDDKHLLLARVNGQSFKVEVYGMTYFEVKVSYEWLSLALLERLQETIEIVKYAQGLIDEHVRRASF